MLRVFFKTVCFLFLCGASASAIVDGARSIAAHSLKTTFVGETIRWIFPNSFASLGELIQSGLEHVPTGHILLGVLAEPTVVCLAVLSLIFGMAARAAS